jgi:hypothetical protein
MSKNRFQMAGNVFTRRQFIHLTAVAFPTAAAAQSYPLRPITMIVAFAAGGPTDAVARIIAERMGVSLAQSVVIENIGGADGSIGVGGASRARPDGYTIVVSSISSHVLNGALRASPNSGPTFLIDRRLRLWPRWSRPMPKNGYRSSRNLESKQSKPMKRCFLNHRIEFLVNTIISTS